MGCFKIVLVVAALAVISSAVRAQEASTDLGTGLLEKLTVTGRPDSLVGSTGSASEGTVAKMRFPNGYERILLAFSHTIGEEGSFQL